MYKVRKFENVSSYFTDDETWHFLGHQADKVTRDKAGCTFE